MNAPADGCRSRPSGGGQEKLTLPGVESSLSAVSRFAMRVASLARLDLPAAYRLRLAVEEIAANIITHGYSEAGVSGPLHLRAEWDDSRLLLHLEDCGLHFDPRRQRPPAHLHLPPTSAKSAGWASSSPSAASTTSNTAGPATTTAAPSSSSSPAAPHPLPAPTRTASRSREFHFALSCSPLDAVWKLRLRT